MKQWSVNSSSKHLRHQIEIRNSLIASIRHFFNTRGFAEVDTPILVKHPGTEPNLEVFSTQLQTLEGVSYLAYLITSPEYSLKKLLSAGIGNCYQITKAFRNGEPVSPCHNPEFTLIEWYRVDADYTAIAADIENLLYYLGNSGERSLRSRMTYQGCQYDLTPPWPRFTLKDLFEKYASIDADTLTDPKKLLQAASTKGYQVTSNDTVDDLFFQIFENEINSHLATLKTPYFLFDFPHYQAALARSSIIDPRFAERFEVYLAGIELGNCFSELTDGSEQRRRIQKDLQERHRLKKRAFSADEDFIQAVSHLPPCAGIALGIDRLLMLLHDLPTIQETLLFPVDELFFAE